MTLTDEVFGLLREVGTVGELRRLEIATGGGDNRPSAFGDISGLCPTNFTF